MNNEDRFILYDNNREFEYNKNKSDINIKFNRVAFIFFVFFLIVGRSLLKNSTKDLDDQIYSLRENIVFLENRFNDSKLEFDYLSSSEKLLEYQKLYFENLLIKKSLKELKTLKIIDKELIISELKISGKINEK